jgi:mannose/fructose-specific phosphotransferase system component IIA
METVFNPLLHSFIATHARAAKKVLQVCEQVKITWSHVRTVDKEEKKMQRFVDLSKCS